MVHKANSNLGSGILRERFNDYHLVHSNLYPPIPDRSSPQAHCNWGISLQDNFHILMSSNQTIFRLTYSQNPSFFLVYFLARDEGEYPLINFIESTGISLCWKLSQLCGHEALEIPCRSEARILTATPQTRQKLRHS